jgi:hypothetical protein
MFADDGETRTGLWLMIEAPDRAGAGTFIAGEGFNRAGMFGAIEIRRFVDTAPASRRQAEITPDPALRMFVCEIVGGPSAAVTAHDMSTTGLAERALAHGLSTTDDGAGVLGAIAIVEVEDRAAAETLAAADPIVQAGAFAEIRIDRWRFGKSVV